MFCSDTGCDYIYSLECCDEKTSHWLRGKRELLEDYHERYLSHDLRGAQASTEGRDKGQCSVWIVGAKLEQHEPPVGGKQAGPEHPGLWRGTADIQDTF